MISKDDNRVIDEMCGLKPPAPAEATAGNRLARLDPKYRAPPVLKELQPRHRLMLQYMVHGVDSPARARQLRVEVAEPMSFYTAADASRVRRREARRLVNDPLFRRALAAEIRAFREMKSPRALQVIEHIMENPGEDKAADRKVRMEAAKSLLGVEHGNAPQTSVNVGIVAGGSQPLRAGVVIRLKTAAPQAPIEMQAVVEAQEDDAEPPRGFPSTMKL